MPPDRLVGADHEVGPAQLLLELLVALLDPVAQAVQPDDLGQVGRGEWRFVRVGRIGVRKVGREIPGRQRRQRGRVVVATTTRTGLSGPYGP